MVQTNKIEQMIYEKYKISKNMDIKNYTTPTSILIKRDVISEFKNHPIGVDINDIVSAAKKYKDNIDLYVEYIHDIYEKEVLWRRDDIPSYSEFANVCENIFTLTVGKRFVVDIPYECLDEYVVPEIEETKTPDYIKNADILKVLDGISDTYIDLRTPSKKYLPFTIKIIKQNYKCNYGSHKNMEPYIIEAVAYRDFMEQGKTSCLTSLILFKELYPKKILLNHSVSEFCPKSANDPCPHSSLYICNSESGIREGEPEVLPYTISVCNMTKRKAETYVCPMLSLRPELLIKIIAYAYDMYLNRHTITRKNSKRKESYSHTKVHVAHEKDINNDWDYTITQLSQYYDNERKSHEWKGGHHSSPVEHERSGYVRRLFDKDGNVKKLVQVKGTTVNKGNSKEDTSHIIHIKNRKE